MATSSPVQRYNWNCGLLLYADGHGASKATHSCSGELQGIPFLPHKPKCVPIAPVTFEWCDDRTQSPRLARQQLPIRLSYALTIHKSQGQTLQKAFNDMGEKERAAGTTFVAMSRLRSLADGLVQPICLFNGWRI